MYIKINDISEQYQNSVWLAYYKFFEKVYGKSLFSRTVKKAIINNVDISEFISSIDHNYRLTSDVLLDNKEIKNVVMLCIYDDCDNLIAIGRCKDMQDSVLIGEVLLIDEPQKLYDKIDCYGEIIETIESYVKTNYLESVVLTLEIPYCDNAYLYAAAQYGYDLEKDEKSQLTGLFDKVIKDKKRARQLDYE